MSNDEINNAGLLKMYEQLREDARDDIADVKADVVALRSEVAEIKASLREQKGFVGGITFLGAGVGAFLAFVVTIAVQHFWK